MASSRPIGSGIFGGVVLITVGSLFLLHYYRGFGISSALLHWWPLLLIAWGVIKLLERAFGGVSATGQRTTAGEVLLVVGVVALIGAVVAMDAVQKHFPDAHLNFGDLGKNSFSYDLDVAPMKVPVDARVIIRAGHGDITVRSGEQQEIRVSGKKTVRGWEEEQADRAEMPINVVVARDGDSYEIKPSGFNTSDSDVSIDMDVVIPNKATLTIRSDRGDINVSDLNKPVVINALHGDVEVRDNAGDVSIDAHHGDIKLSDIKGDAKISGSGGEVEVTGVTGGLTLNGEFYGPIRCDKIDKGVRFISHRTDLTLTQLAGHLELGSGNLEIADASGNLMLRTNSYDVTIENVSGKVDVDSRNGSVSARFSAPPKEDIQILNANSTISLTLPESSSFNLTADGHSGEINSEFSSDTLTKTSAKSGDSRLEGKYGSGRAPNITLKTSYGSISIDKTS